MPPELLIIGADMWLPLQASPSAWPRGARQFTILARIADGATLQQVNAELGALAARTTAAFGNEFKEYDGWRLTAAPWADALTRSLQPAAYLLLGAIAFVLLIVCVNLANLQLSQAMSRQREMAVRIALGAGRWRVARQLLVESLMLASAGCALGLLLAESGLRAAVSLLPAQLVALDPRVGFSGRVMIVSIAAALVCAVIVGILPAIRAMRTDPFETLKDDAQRTTASASANRVRHGLIVAEIALAMILLAGAGLLVRTMIHLSRLQPGVDARNVLTMRLTLPAEKYRGPAIIPFFDRLVDEVRNIPGVRDGGRRLAVPAGRHVHDDAAVRSSHRGAGAGASDGTGAGGALTSDYTIASPGVFETLGIPLRTGRIFSDADTATAPGVAVVNESFARRFYPGGASPIGQRIAAADPKAPWLTIVGIVADTRGRGVMREPRPELFVPVRQMPQFWNQLFLIVRTDGEPRAMLPAIRGAIASIDRDQPAYAIQTLVGSVRRVTLRAAHADGPALAVRGAGDDAGGDRDLRGDVVCRHHADAGDRHPHGARRGRAHGESDGRASGVVARRPRRDDWPGRRAGAGPRHLERARGHLGGRSDHAGRGHAAARRRRAARRIPAGPPREPHRSDRRAARRVEQASTRFRRSTCDGVNPARSAPVRLRASRDRVQRRQTRSRSRHPEHPT